MRRLDTSYNFTTEGAIRALVVSLKLGILVANFLRARAREYSLEMGPQNFEIQILIY